MEYHTMTEQAADAARAEAALDAAALALDLDRDGLAAFASVALDIARKSGLHPQDVVRMMTEAAVQFDITEDVTIDLVFDLPKRNVWTRTRVAVCIAGGVCVWAMFRRRHRGG